MAGVKADEGCEAAVRAGDDALLADDIGETLNSLREGNTMAHAYDGSLRFGLFHAPFHSKRLNPTYALERDLLLADIWIV